ncbi:MAG: hypothetical protein AAGE52_00390 [Myxococcota bacterium]
MTRWLVLVMLLGIACGDDDGSTDAGTGASDTGTDASADAGDPTPRTVTLEVTPGVVPEEPTTTVSFRLTLDAEPPASGTRVYVLGDLTRGLTQLDVFALSVDPSTNARPQGDLDFSGFTLLMTSREVTVSIDSFADGEAEDPVDVMFRVVPFEEVPWGELPVDGAEAAAPYVVGDPATAMIRLQDSP